MSTTQLLKKLLSQIDELKAINVLSMNDRDRSIYEAKSFAECPDCIWTDDGESTDEKAYVCEYHQSAGMLGIW